MGLNFQKDKIKIIIVISIILFLTGLVGCTHAGTYSKKQEYCEKAIIVWESIVGYDYGWGAESPKEGSFDCSGAIYFVQKQIGKPIPRTTSRKLWILAGGDSKDWSNSTCGDWTFFTLSPDRPKGHVGMITKNPNFYQSGSSTGPNKEKFIKNNFWDNKHVGTKSPEIDK